MVCFPTFRIIIFKKLIERALSEQGKVTKEHLSKQGSATREHYKSKGSRFKSIIRATCLKFTR